jgi:hypothetical protein
MIMAKEGGFSLVDRDTPPDSSRIAALRHKINDENYLYEAIQRIAQVLSNEIMGVSRGGAGERKRR